MQGFTVTKKKLSLLKKSFWSRFW